MLVVFYFIFWREASPADGAIGTKCAVLPVAVTESLRGSDVRAAWHCVFAVWWLIKPSEGFPAAKPVFCNDDGKTAAPPTLLIVQQSSLIRPIQSTLSLCLHELLRFSSELLLFFLIYIHIYSPPNVFFPSRSFKLVFLLTDDFVFWCALDGRGDWSVSLNNSDESEASLVSKFTVRLLQVCVACVGYVYFLHVMGPLWTPSLIINVKWKY